MHPSDTSEHFQCKSVVIAWKFSSDNNDMLYMNKTLTVQNDWENEITSYSGQKYTTILKLTKAIILKCTRMKNVKSVLFYMTKAKFSLVDH